MGVVFGRRASRPRTYIRRIVHDTITQCHCVVNYSRRWTHLNREHADAGGEWRGGGKMLERSDSTLYRTLSSLNVDINAASIVYIISRMKELPQSVNEARS